jgi:hypothetical protein
MGGLWHYFHHIIMISPSHHQVVLRYEKATAPPVLLLLALRDGDQLLGMALLNLCREAVKVETLVVRGLKG